MKSKIDPSSDKYHFSLLQSIQAGVVVHNADTSIEMTNTTAQRLLDLTEEQMLGKTAIDPAWKFVCEDGATLPLEEFPVNRVLATGQALQNMTLGVFRPSLGDIAWVLVSAIPTFDRDGDLHQVVVTFVDISVRKHAEEEREELIKQLQSALAEVKTLKGIIPICAYCKRIRDDSGYWNQVEAYISRQSQAEFSHGICPECEELRYKKLGIAPDD